ncbi:MAG: hypothetical protein P4L62_02370 [Candidatus Pacebacteria bacterium]|nr:hypothetical protein [Candidatus Paceibacterota bacterium]
MASILDRCVQLIIQSNDYCLMPDFEIRRIFRRVWDMAEYAENPERPVYLQPNGRAFTEDEPWLSHYQRRSPKRPYYYYQSIRTIYLTEAAFAYKDPYTFYSDYQKRDLYLQFISLKTKNDLAKFVENKKDFCIFPDIDDMKLLIHRYVDEIKTARYIFAHTMTDPVPKDRKKEYLFVKEKIREINLEYLWDKKEYLKSLLDLYKSGELKFSNLSSIHYYLEQSSEMFIDKKYYDIAKIGKSVNFKYPPDKRTFEEIKGFRKIDDAGQLVPGYRVYGHFALCCLQFYLLVKSQKSVDVCPLCKTYFKKEHKSQQFCSDICKKKAASKRSLKHQKKS